MKLLKLLSLSFAVILIAAQPSSNKISIKQIAYGNNLFAFELYKEIAKKEKGNIFFSPFSISTALAMTYAGADGKTAEEMASTMHFNANNEEFHMSYGNYLKTLESNAKGNIQLQIANRLWGDEKYDLIPEFLSLNKKAYNSPLEKLNFRENPNDSRIKINDWVAEKTEDRIKNLIPSGAISSDTKLVLTNAIYFKGDWLYKFEKSKTKDRKFNKIDGSKKETPFMNFKGSFSFSQNGFYKSIILPYKGNKQSMLVILPHKNEDLKKVESMMNPSIFSNLMMRNNVEVILSIPKFKITLPLSLNAPIINLGIKEAFAKTANFSKMTKVNDLYISDVIHKAFIEIDEEGTEAAAATAVVMTVTCTSVGQTPKPNEFIADHPFLFYIIDNETQAILFMGKIMEPIK